MAMVQGSKRTASHSRSPPILGLPSELLIDILAGLRPSDVSAFAQTCRLAAALVEESSHLWLALFNKAWDPPGPLARPLPIMSQREAVRIDGVGKGKGKGKARAVSPEKDGASLEHSMQAKVKQRMRARINLRRGSEEAGRIRHSETLRTLVDAARSRSDRVRCATNPNLDLPPSKSAATLSSMFVADRIGDARWSAFVYPREKLVALKAWQQRASAASESGQARTPSSSGRPCAEDQATVEELSPSRSRPIAPSSRVRRSARLLSASVPLELQDFLDFDADEDPHTWLSRFEINEELAAELHCLHGIRPVAEPLPEGSQDTQRLGSRKKRRQETREDGNVSDDSMSASTLEELPAAPQDSQIGTQPAEVAPSMTQFLMVTDFDDSEDDEDWTDPGYDDDFDEDGDPDDVDFVETEVGAPHGGRQAQGFFGTQRGRYGPTALGSIKGPAGDRNCRSDAKDIVFDSGRYAYENAWGPFKPFRQGGASRSVAQPSTGPFASDSSSDSSDEDDENDQGTGQPTAVQQAIAMGLFEEHGAPSTPSSGDEHELNGANEGATPAETSGAATPADDDFQSVLNVDTGGAEDEDDDSEFDDGDIPIIPFWGPGTPRFTQMVSVVGAYAGSKVRCEVERLRARDEPEQKGAQSGTATETSPTAQVSRGRSATKWQRTRYIDWLMLESVMVATHCSLVYAIRNEGWGSGFNLPHGARGDSPQGLGPEDHCVHVRQRRLLLPVSGWNVSRGERPSPSQPTSAALAEASTVGDSDATVQAVQDEPSTSKIYDWAGIETATWAGTYFFCDYPIFLVFNAERAGSSLVTPDSTRRLPDEAVGDCLQLHLELRRPEEQKPEFEEGIENSESYGEEDPEFPTLRFSGVARTYVSFNQDPVPRGQAHGFARPVYAEADPTQGKDSHLTRYHAPSGRWLPAIAGIHWSITHAYEGQDRWRLCGVQAGPPGTRAPIYGAWGDIDNEAGSPVGPFVYFNVDSRPWREVEDKITREKLQREALARDRRAARDDQLRSDEQGEASDLSAGTVTTADLLDD